MQNYIIEGNIDFFSDLYKSLDENKKNECYEKNDLCLISNEPLVDKFIKLECGHKFNYVPLFYDIKNHKQKFNTMEGTHNKLNYNEIRCPYCRHKIVGVLPYYEEFGFSKLHGVNYLNPNYVPGYSYKKCEYINKNVTTTTTITEDNINNNCCNMGTQLNYSGNGIFEEENYGDNKYYCWIHKKQMIKIYKKEKLIKEKEILKKQKIEEKQKLIEEKKKVKEEKEKEKLQEKEAQKSKLTPKAKPKQKIQENENLIINTKNSQIDMSNNVILTKNNFCTELLKTGLKKGTICGCKVFIQTKCKRHLDKILK